MALTSARARTSVCSPFASRMLTRHMPASRRASVMRVRGRISAPRSRAPMALMTTSRASSTRASEYTKPLRNLGSSPAPHLSAVSSTPNEEGRVRRPPEMVIEKKSRSNHPCRPQMGLVREHELQRLDDVRRRCKQHFALGQRLRTRGGTRSTRDSAVRRGSAWCSTTTCAPPDRPFREAPRSTRGRRRHARYRRR